MLMNGTGQSSKDRRIGHYGCLSSNENQFGCISNHSKVVMYFGRKKHMHTHAPRIHFSLFSCLCLLWHLDEKKQSDHTLVLLEDEQLHLWVVAALDTLLEAF